MRTLGLLVLAATTVTLWNDLPVLADGCMLRPVGQSGSIVRSPRQEALLATDGQTVEVILRTHFVAGPTELAWVVPVPAKPTDIKPADEASFDRLERTTAPKFYEVSHGGGGFGCGCGDNLASHGLGAEHPLVVVESAGTAGVFDFTVLSSSDANALTDWLNRNKYYVPPQAPAVFGRYVKAGWFWLAMRVRPEAAKDKVTIAPHPIRYVYKSDKLVYPMAISRLSADAKNEIVLYVMAGKRFACDNWANWTMDRVQIHRNSAAPSGTNYEQLLGAQTRQATGRLFVTEFARESTQAGWNHTPWGMDTDLDKSIADNLRPNYWLTRLRAVIEPDAMDRDVELSAAPPKEQVPIESERMIVAASDLPGAAGTMALVGMICGGTMLTRKSVRLRGAGMAMILLACLAAATM